MRTTFPVLAYLAYSGHGRRLRNTNEKMQDNSYEGHTHLQMGQLRSDVQARIPMPQKGLPIVLALSNVAVNNPRGIRMSSPAIRSRSVVWMKGNSSTDDDFASNFPEDRAKSRLASLLKSEYKGQGKFASSLKSDLQTSGWISRIISGSSRGRRKELRREHELRRDEWLAQYGTLQALQSTFGTGPPWGDLSPQETRKLYHALLPRVLLGLGEMEILGRDELAPLAYEARIAAKEYARSRCVISARVATLAFDQYRSLRDDGKLRSLNTPSVTWEEIWAKYQSQIVQEEYAKELVMERYTRRYGKRNGKRREALADDETLTMRIYLRILERSCATNEAFDNMFLTSGKGNDNLPAIATQLENDVRSILAKAMRKMENAPTKQREAETTRQQTAENVKQKQQKAAEKQQKAAEKQQIAEENKQSRAWRVWVQGEGQGKDDN